MVYVDETGVELESVDLTLGYLVDDQWVDHPAQAQQGHYEYTDTQDGGVVQNFVVDVPASPAWREVTVRKYILYTQDELNALQKSDYAKRLDALEDSASVYGASLAAIQEGVVNA